MSGSDSDDQDTLTVADDIVVTKYKVAGDIINSILKRLLERCVPDARILDICEAGDKWILEETDKIFKKNKDMKKGLAFPTCVSVNNIVCHFSPLSSDPVVFLKEGDVVKLDLGCHVDGFCGLVGHSIVVCASEANPVTGRKADVFWAAHQMAEAALRLVKPGAENLKVTETTSAIAAAYGCKPVEGMLSHQLSQHVIDGEKVFMLNPSDDQRGSYEKCEFDVHEVYAVDILVSTGEGKPRDVGIRTTVYKKKDTVYQLKLKMSRQFYSAVDKRYHLMPFSLRSCGDEARAKMGVKECVNHGVLQPFTVYSEKEGETVVQFKYTVLLMPNGPHKITGLPFNEKLYVTEKKIEDVATQTLLSSSVQSKAAKKKKRKAQKAAAESVEAHIKSAE